MFEIEELCKKYLNDYPGKEIIGILDIGDEYIIHAKEKGKECSYTPSLAMSKINGQYRTFFPLENMEKLKNAKKVEVPLKEE